MLCIFVGLHLTLLDATNTQYTLDVTYEQRYELSAIYKLVVMHRQECKLMPCINNTKLGDMAKLNVIDKQLCV